MTSYLTGPNNVTRSVRQNTSYKKPWVPVYENTILDSWFVGDYASASYHITVEFDSNQKETMQVLVVARPNHASYTVFGRTSIQDELITLSASVTASKMTLTATPASSEFAGAKAIFSATYSETITPLSLPTIVPSSSSGTAGMPTPSEIFGTFSTITVPSNDSIVASYELDTLNITSGTGINIITDSLTKTLTFNLGISTFKNISVAGSTTLVPNLLTDTLTFAAGNGITINTVPASNTINISSVLPIASNSTLGGVKVDNSSITITNGVISAVSEYTLPTASQTEKGGVKVDGTTITINNSVIRATLYAGTTLLNSTSGNLALTGITGFSTTASNTATPSLNIAVNTGANSVTGLSYSTLASGSITIASGLVASGKSGGVTINTGNATSSGDINIKPGTSTSYAAELRISAGDGNLADISYGGNTFISAGSGLGGSISSNGGITFISGGNPSGFTVDSTGGDVYIVGGAASPSASGIATNGNVMIGTQTTATVNIASTSNSSKNINIGSSTSTTTITGTAKLPTVGTSGLVKLGTGGTLSAVTPSNGYLNWTGSAFAWSEPTIPTASTSVLGGVKVDGNTIIIDNGIISVGSSITNGLSIGTTLTIPTGNTESRPTATQGNLRFNTSLGKFEGYYGSAWGAVGGGLSPTAIQAADGYVAKANDLVRCNTTSVAFSITLPSAPVDGDIIGVIDTHRKFALNNLTILAAGSKTIEDDTSLVLDIDGSYIALVYNDVNSNWRVLETPLGTGTSSTTIINSNGYIASVNDLVRCDTTAAAFSVTLPTSPYDGSIVNFVDVASAGSFFTNNLTVLPGSGSTIENDTSLTLAVNGAYVSLVYNQSSTNWKVLQGSQGSLPTASTTQLGGVKVDGNTITIDGSGVISSAGGGLSPTAIQAADGYVAKANDLVRCNTTSGSFSITLPSAPVDGDIIGVIDTHRKFALNNLIILAAGSKTIEDDTTSLVLDINGSYIALVYNDVNSNWRILETPTGTGIISTAIKTSNGYIASVNDLVRCDTTATAFSVTLPTSPNDGSIVNFVDVASAGSFFTNNLTVLPGSGNTVQNTSSLILNANGTYVSLVYNQSSTNWKVLQGSQVSLPTASTSVLGGVIIPAVATSGINNTSGTIGLAIASSTQLGGVKVDNSTIIINGSGVISSVGGGGGASATKTISNKTGAYTVVAGDLGKIINFTGSSSATITLTAAATLGAGFTCAIWNTSTTFGAALTIDPNLAETIGTYVTYILRPGEGLEIVCDGVNWQTSNRKGMNAYAENWNGWSRPVASGNASMAFGDGSATANQSFAHSLYTGAGNASATNAYGWAVGMNSTGAGSVTATGLAAMALGGSYASGTDSFAAAIGNNTSSYGATGTNSIAIGKQATASGTLSVSVGLQGAATGSYAVCLVSNGYGNNTASGDGSLCLGSGGLTSSAKQSTTIGTYLTASALKSVAIGVAGNAAQTGKYVYSSGSFIQEYNVAGDSQFGKIILRALTTTNTAVVLTSDGAAAWTTNQLIVASNQAMTFFGTLIAKQSASNNMAAYKLSGAISNNAGTIALAAVTIEKIVDTIVLDAQPTFTADSTNKALAITSGYKTATSIRWVCNIDSVEVTYA